MSEGHKQMQSHTLEGTLISDIVESELVAGVPAIDETQETDQETAYSALMATVHALLFVHGEPLSVVRLSELTGSVKDQIKAVLEELTLLFEDERSGVEVVCVAGEFQLRSKPQFAEIIRQLKTEPPKRLTNPALETLAIIAYRQPIVKSDVERIRGVDATPTIKTLLDRNLIKIAGHQPSVGQPALYGTTDEFLKLFGLRSLAELPTLRDLKELDSDPGEVEMTEEREDPAGVPENICGNANQNLQAPTVVNS